MQKLIRGEAAVNRSAGEIAGAGYDAVFLITGRHFREQSDLDFLKDLQLGHYIKDGANVDEAEEGRAFIEFSKQPGRAILAIGGGSVIDLAKAILFRCKGSGSTPLFIAAPTTAGSGSEATSFAVVYRSKKKISIDDPLLLPAIAILDPSLTYHLPASQTAVSGMDVLAQAIESYWSKKANKESKAYAAEAILIWKEYFQRSVTAPDPTIRERMLWAAHLAGKAINITRTTGPHALSYYLTAHHQVPHGQAVALYLPVFFLYNEPERSLYDLLGVGTAAEAKNFIEQEIKTAGLATSYSELGLDKENILNAIPGEVNQERFDNNPVAFEWEKLKSLLEEYL